MRRSLSAAYITLAFVLILAFGLMGRFELRTRWLLIMGVMLLLLVIAGLDITGSEAGAGSKSTTARLSSGRFDGVLIDDRNKISLSRLQLLLWTVVVLSAWSSLALHRVMYVAEGRLLGSGIPLVREVAGLLAGEDAADDAELRSAAAMLEQITGSEVALPAAEEESAATPVLYDPLNITIPTEVLAALGISLTSLAGAGLIKTRQSTDPTGKSLEVADARISNATIRAGTMSGEVESMRRDKDQLESLATSGLESMDDDPAAARQALAAVQPQLAAMERKVLAAEAAEAVAKQRLAELETSRATAIGQLDAHVIPAEARWSDMLRGDTVANFQFIDLGKVQMLFLTVVLVFAYAALIWSIMSMDHAARVLQLVPSMTLPAFSESLVFLMALSHGGYLATKAAA